MYDRVNFHSYRLFITYCFSSTTNSSNFTSTSFLLLSYFFIFSTLSSTFSAPFSSHSIFAEYLILSPSHHLILSSSRRFRIPVSHIPLKHIPSTSFSRLPKLPLSPYSLSQSYLYLILLRPGLLSPSVPLRLPIHTPG